MKLGLDYTRMMSFGPGYTGVRVLTPSPTGRTAWLCVVYILVATVNGQVRETCPALGRPDGRCNSDCPVYLPLANQLSNSTLIPFFKSDLGRHLLRYVHRCCHFRHPLLGDQPEVRFDRPPNARCGTPAPAAGTDIHKRGAWPWLVALGERRRSGEGFRAVCGGSVVSRRHVLTSAHCLFLPPQYKPKHARIGDFDLFREDDGADPQDLDILSHLHPGYDSATHKNDIALLTLSGDVIFNDYVFPACLPLHQRQYPLDDGQLLTVVGYGSASFGGPTSALPLAAQVPVVDLRRCQASYQSVGNRILPDDSQLCAGDDQDACVGDGGSPLNYRDPATGTYYVVGIVSFGTKTCGDPLFPTIYTRVGAFMPWITANIGDQA